MNELKLLITKYFLIIFILVGLTKPSLSQQLSLVYPKDNVCIFDSIIDFTWNKINSNDYIFYNLEIALDATFLDIVYTSSDLNLTYEKVSLNYSSYYWRVKAIIQGVEVESSNVNKFKIVDIFSIDALSLLLRADSNVVLDSFNSVIEWNNLIDNSNNATQIIESYRPLFVSSSGYINNQPSINFDGINDKIELNNSIDISELYVFMNWTGDSLFSSYNGALTGKTSNILFIGLPNDSNLYNGGVFGNKVYVNGLQTRNFSPLVEYKIVSGNRINSITLDDLLIGQDRSLSGRYWNGNIASIIGFNQVLSDSLRLILNDYFRYYYAPPVNLSYDFKLINFCSEDIAVNNYFKDYLWSTNEVDSFITITKPGKYWVDVIDIFGNTSSDTIIVSLPGNYLKSFSLCAGQDSIWDTQLNKTDYSFLWQDGSTDSVMVMTEPGDYYCSITSSSGCTYDTDTITFSWNSYTETAKLPTTPTICANGLLQLESGAEETVSYEWYSDASPTLPISTEASIVPDASQHYWVVAQNDIGCVATDSSFVTYYADIPSPKAGYSSSKTCENDLVQFTDTSQQTGSSIVEWEWTINNESSTFQNPFYTFENWGLAQVSLKVINEVGCTDSLADSLMIFPKPIVGYTTDLNFCVENQITFTDTSLIPFGTIDSVQWAFLADSLWLANGLQTQQAFSQSGLIPLTLTVTSDQFCTDSLVNELTIRPRPSGSFMADTICFGVPLHAFGQNDTTGVGPASYEWLNADFEVLGNLTALELPTGDGTPYDQAGQYALHLSLQTLDKYCSDTIIGSFNLYEHPPTEILSDQQCVGEPVELGSSLAVESNQYITSWLWTSAQGDTLSTDTFLTYSPLDTGYYHYSLQTQTQFPGCVNQVLDSFFVYFKPDVSILLPDNRCLNDPLPLESSSPVTVSNANLNYQWVLNNALYPANDSIIYPVFSTTGPVVVQLTATNLGNCTRSDTVSFSVIGAEANAFFTQVCAGEPTPLSALPDTNYSMGYTSAWLLNDSLVLPGKTIDYTFSEGGSYPVINLIQDTVFGCIDTDTLLVKVSDIPQANFIAHTGCADDPFVLISASTAGNDPIGSWTWQSALGNSDGVTFPLIVGESGNYDVSHIVTTLEAGCRDTVTKVQIIFPLPDATFTFAPESGLLPLDVSFSASDNFIYYAWDFGTGNSSNQAQPEYTYIDIGLFTIELQVIDTNNCFNTHRDSIAIKAPLFDVELMAIEPEQNGSFMVFNLQVRNNGYYPITDLAITTTLGNGIKVQTTESVAIEGGQTAWINASNAIQTTSDEAGYACFTVDFIEPDTDYIPENNTDCLSLIPTIFHVFPPFPNPGDDQLSLRLNLPKAGTVNITLANQAGQAVESYAFTGDRGLNEVLLDVSKLRSGSYYVKVVHRDYSASFKWVKNKK